MRSAIIIGVLGLASMAAFVHCSASPEVCRASECAALGPDATDASDGSTQPPICDPAKDPSCVSSDVGLFVDGKAGDDTAAGTKEKPVRSIGAAITKLGAKTRIFVCEGSYPEAVKLTSAASIQGGFACGTWEYTGAKAAIAPSTRGIALWVANATSEVLFSDLDVTAQNGSDPGESSIAMFVASSENVILRRVKITAGKGITGKKGTSPPDFAEVAPSGKAGNVSGKKTENPACPTSIGGAGGASQGREAIDDGEDGSVKVSPSFPSVPLSDGIGGKRAAGTCNGSEGNPGSYGKGGAAGGGATALGKLTPAGWTPESGSEGGKGADGQGGGGGARLGGAAIGGGGGAGGCGGAGGGGGQGGGSSIAIAIFESGVEIEGSNLIAADAGDGAEGGKGGKAQMNGAGGTVPNESLACAGGMGGVGGSGGGGGGGAGGISAGVLYVGIAPKIDGASLAASDAHPSIVLGKNGAKGSFGSGGDPARTTAPLSLGGDVGEVGLDGHSKAVIKVQ